MQFNKNLLYQNPVRRKMVVL